MLEIVFALLLISDNQITEHRIQDSISQCVKGKRIAERQLKDTSTISYQCIKSNAETEIYMAEKSIKKLILE